MRVWIAVYMKVQKYVTLKGTAKDPDHDALSYSWEQTGGDPVVLNDANTPKPTFNVPDVDGDKVLAFKLTVSDGKGGQGNDNVKIRIRDRLPAISNQIINNHFYEMRIRVQQISTRQSHGDSNSIDYGIVKENDVVTSIMYFLFLIPF